MNDIGSGRRFGGAAAIRTIAATRSSSVESATASTPARRNASLQLGLAPVGRLLEPTPEPLVVRVDVELLAGLGILHEHRPDVGQLDLARVVQADRDHLVPLGQQLERPLPAGRADEVRDDEDERAALDPALARLEQRAEVRERRRGLARMGLAGR